MDTMQIKPTINDEIEQYLYEKTNGLRFLVLSYNDGTTFQFTVRLAFARSSLAADPPEKAVIDTAISKNIDRILESLTADLEWALDKIKGNSF